MVNAPVTGTSLGGLFDLYGSDKTRSGYHKTYEPLLKHRRDTITAVLEIFIGTLDPAAPSTMVGYAAPHYQPGGSLRAWRDWFPNATVWGLDTQPDTQFADDRIITRLADSTDAAQIDAALEAQLFELIIDDGDHHPDSQIKTLTNLWGRINQPGAYIIEDILDEHAIHQLLATVADLDGKPTANINPARNFMAIVCTT
jgi:hypothetical protein